MTKMKVISLFSGAGGMDWGFKKAGFEVIWANDIYQYAREAYKKNFGLEPKAGDIRKHRKFPKADVLIACNPCQGFSMIGKRVESDKRNLLYREIFKVLKIVRPKYVVIENVKGLKLLYEGKFFDRIENAFKRHGYRVYSQILDAKDYGVPQHRERIIIVGLRKDIKVQYEFPTPTHGTGPGLRPYVTLRKAIGRMPAPKPSEYYSRDDWSFFYMSRNRRARWDDVSFTIQAEGREVALHPGSPPMMKAGKDRFVFKGPKERYRRLSIKECARIQTFPANFKFCGFLESQYRLIGNAVPPRLAMHIAESIKKAERRRLAAVAAAKRKRASKRKAIRRKASRMVRYKREELAVAPRLRPIQIAHRRKAIAANRRWTRIEGLPKIHR